MARGIDHVNFNSFISNRNVLTKDGDTAFTFKVIAVHDKIAGFLNIYLKLGIDPGNVTIRRVWHDRKALRQQFEQRPNWHLRGLYWLSRDVADDHDADSEVALEPDSRQLKQLRHALEHRSLVLREMDEKDDMGAVQTLALGLFETKTLKLLKLVRAALIHLALAVHAEEQDRSKQEQGPLLDNYFDCVIKS